MNLLALHCNPAGRIAVVIRDDGAVLGDRATGRMLSSVLVPSGVGHFFELLGCLEEADVVCGWTLEFGTADEPVVYHCSAARNDGYVLILGGREPLGQREISGLVAETGSDEARDLAARISARLGDEGALMADMRRQVEALQYQMKSPIRLENKLLRAAAHDIRNPLLVVSMNCSFLLHDCDSLTQEQRDLLSDAVATCEFMNRFLDGMTSLAELWVGKLRLETELINLDEFVRYSAEHNARCAAKRDIVIELTSAAPMTVFVDKRKMTHVLNQLFSNVMKFCPAGSTARVKLERCGDEGILTIEDDGPGMTAAVRDKAFRPFGKTHAETTAPEDYGAGVGLAISRRLVEAFGGRIALDSSEGRGTRIEIALPIAAK